MSDITEELKKATGLVSLPEVYMKIKQLMADEDSDIADFAEVVRLDPNLSLAVLKTVNSAFFGFPKKIENILQATNMIGIGQLHSIVLGLSAVSALNWSNDFVPLKTLWKSSIFSGVLAQLLGKQEGLPRSDTLFVKGLLHEVGHLILYAKFPELMHKVVELVEQEQIAIHQAESRVLGCQYGEVGSMLLSQWGLEEDYHTVVRLQPTPEVESDYQKSISFLHLAHAYAHQYAGTVNTIDDMINPIAWDISELTKKSVEDVIENARAISGEMESVIAC